MTIVKISKLREDARIPKYMSSGASGVDVYACLVAPVEVLPMERVSIPTGLSLEIPVGYEIQVRPRSGLAFKQGLTVVNAPGTIDSDYRGEVKILLVNLSKVAVKIQPSDRIAQLVLQKVERIEWSEVSELSDTARGVGGFGSTGVFSV